MSENFRKAMVVFIAVLASVLVIFNPLYGVDSFITDHLYTKLSGTDSKIIIVGVDEETLAAYGNFNVWSREKMAALINKMYENPENAPAVVGLDFIFADDYYESSDKMLVDAIKDNKANVVAGTNIVYRGRVEHDSKGGVYYNTEHIEKIEMPFDGLSEVVTPGFTNECIAKDGYVRYAMNAINLPEDIGKGFQDSFACAVYKQYYSVVGEKINIPGKNSNSQFQFRYSGQTGEFSKLSLEAILDNRVPSTAFKDAIVLVGAYAPGFQDSYQPASDRGSTMYGVEIHANIIQAYMQGKTMVVANRFIMAFMTVVLLELFFMLAHGYKLPIRMGSSLVFAGGYLFVGRLIAVAGLCIPCVYMLIMIAIIDFYFVVDNYQKELKEQMWSFTEAMAAAVDERTPYNASHTRNVARYCGMVVDYINSLNAKGLEKEYYSQSKKEQLVFAALLHDIGKMAVPLAVMNKSTRLGGREKDIEKRFEKFRLQARVAMYEQGKSKDWCADISNKTFEAWDLICRVNAVGFIEEETRNELEKVMQYEYEGEPFFTDEEKDCLRIVKGTLTEAERKVMESHVVITKRILSKVHFNRQFRNTVELAGQHHEFLNGKGYPDGLTAKELSSGARIMAVADICDALLATDRPYKKPVPMEKAFEIMRDMAEKGNIDGKYVEYLYYCLKQRDKLEG
ncbi:MAG: CHASE2 domain-containing protein [Lachnospiraceae bacterium]|jgi:HD-GYP domain-containing protein (c-di-GMP phosphodiesterase class II)|nr:CHASE2 domain-containing protein [Lachnospiraceae bacterium]